MRRSGVLSIALGMVFLGGGWRIDSSVRAGASIVVETTGDVVTVDGLCSLREAVIAANMDTAFSDCPTGSGADTIEFSPDLPSPTLLVLTNTGADEDDAQTGDLDIAGNLTITGSSVGAIILDGNATDRVLEILPGAQVTVTGVTIRNGNPGSGQDGGGVLVDLTGTLALTDTVVTHNTALRGGGIKVLGGLTASDSAIDANQGGGIDNDGGWMSLTDVNITDNTGGYGVHNRNQGVLLCNGGLVDGNLGGGIFNDRASASLSGLSITNNTSGGIHNAGAITAKLTLSQSTIMSNTATSGAGIFNSGLGTDVYINETRISNNHASLAGGGVYNSGKMTIEKSTIDHNQARSGGGVDHRGGSLHMTNDTIGGNSVTDNGGGIHNAFGIFLTNVTLVANTAQGNGGGIFNNEANAYPKNTIIALNQATDGNCSNSEFANLVSQGHNLDDDNTCSLTAMGDLANLDPVLGPLQDNGGPTHTNALLVGSPAIDKGNHDGCPSTDQRGVARPQGSACDIGAYEFISGIFIKIYLPISLK